MTGDDEAAAALGARSRIAGLGDVRLHYVEAGRGPLVVLLHGFPNFWYLWRRQMTPLVAAGFRVVAPDLRGYNASSKPRGVAAYRVDTLAGDVRAVIEALGSRDAVVVGHDWGGVVAWRLAQRYPELVRRLVVLNAPHPGALARELRTPGQLARSSYALFFQLPLVPELVLRALDFAALERVLRHEPVRPGAFDDEDLRRHKASWRVPGALRAALGYYRAAGRRSPRKPLIADRRVTCPTLLLWGDRDRFLRRELTEGLERWVPGIEVVRIAASGHWPMADVPDLVNERLASFAAG